MKKLLYLSALWPEPTSSAAGIRTMQMLQLFVGAGYDVCFAATAKENEHSVNVRDLGIRVRDISLNDSAFDVFITEEQPDIVVFDRFMLEEQFAMRVMEHCPQALRVLDTSDVHFLRRARERAINKQQEISLLTEDCYRELASYYRSDVTILISEAEYELLRGDFNVSEGLLHYCPFLIHDDEITSSTRPFEQRSHVVMIGNFLHKPNLDAVRWMREDIWPLVRKRNKLIECHVYGAYISDQQRQQLHNEANGFLICDRAQDAQQCLESYRINLAPLRFGAGLKGKLIDGFMAGTPTVSTTIATEGIMLSRDTWPGMICDDSEAFAAAVCQLYEDESSWVRMQSYGYDILKQRFSMSEHGTALLEALEQAQVQLVERRQKNIIGAMLCHHSMKSTYYMSKWIEEKTLRAAGSQPNLPTATDT